MSETTAPFDPEPTEVSGFEHAIVESEDGPECTIYPEACDRDEIVTRWVTAGEGSFVSIADVR